MDEVLQFLFGGLAIMCGAIGFFFLRYWYVQRDRFFLWLMAAFILLGFGWGVHLMYASSTETGPGIYLVRLLAFLTIIVAIIDKNRRASG